MGKWREEQIGDARLILGDCLEIMPTLPENSIDLILTDPPYFKFKNEPWDHQWDSPEGFIEWVSSLCKEWYRLLKPNGSLYVFASSKMSARVEVKIGELFNVLNRILWKKEAGWHHKTSKDTLRSYLSPSEYIIFAEHYGSDNIAKGETSYVSQCDELRGFVFETLREYLKGELDRAGWTTRRVAEEFQKKTGSRTITGMAAHWFNHVQWELPTEENYQWLRNLFNNGTSDKYLRREYEDLRREYEDLRRPFSISADVPYTDVWDYPTVQSYNGKHPCEKPPLMMKHIIEASSRENANILDCFMGSGVVGDECCMLNRKFIGMEKSEHWFNVACKRIDQAERQGQLFEPAMMNGSQMEFAT